MRPASCPRPGKLAYSLGCPSLSLCPVQVVPQTLSPSLPSHFSLPSRLIREMGRSFFSAIKRGWGAPPQFNILQVYTGSVWLPGNHLQFPEKTKRKSNCGAEKLWDSRPKAPCLQAESHFLASPPPLHRRRKKEPLSEALSLSFSSPPWAQIALK